MMVFGQALAAPVITSFTPVAGAPGDQVQLNGSGFSGGNYTVRFWNGGNGVVVTSGFVNSDTLLTVVVPSGITTGPISIQEGTGAQLYTTDDFLAVGFGPYIMSFSPTLGSVNDTVTLGGVHLTNTTGVKFGGVSATEFTPNAAGTQITTRVPVGATNGPITVSTIFGTSNTSTAFIVAGAGPYITGFSPITGGTATQVQLTGLHFTGVTNVTFSGQTGTGLAANSDTLIQVHPPAGVLTGPIKVFTPAGSFVTSSNFFGSPAITSFSPASGRANTNVVINGTNLLGASAVLFGSVNSTSFTVQSNSKITAQVPAGSGTGLIRVIVPGGSAFSATNFVVAPTILSFSPNAGPPGTTVQITGVNLDASIPTVRFNGVAASTPTTITPTQLVVKVPAGTSTGPISVTTVAGSDTNGNRFFLPPSITSISSTNSGPGSTITLLGQNFLGATAVTFNGVAAATFTVTNNTSLSAVVPDNVVSGSVSVTTPAGSAPSSAVFYGAPRIVAFTPTHGLPGNNVTIHGLNFLGARVSFSGLAAAVTSLSNTQLVATVPAGAKSGPITVAGPAGTNTSTATFTLDYTSDLSVSITNSANPVTVGSNLTFTIVIFNKGPFAAPNATFTNTLPTTVTLTGVSVPAGWLVATNGSTLSGSATNLEIGAVIPLFVTVRTQAPGDITATVTASSDYTDPVLGDNTASIVTTVEPVALLSIGAVDDGVKVAWPATLTNYVLEFRDGLFGNTQWSAVTNPPTTSGGLEFVTETNLGPLRFYRLKR